MPSIFKKKKQAPEPEPEPQFDAQELISKVTKQLAVSKQEEIKCKENAKQALRNNNQQLAKMHLNQLKMHQANQKNLMSQLTMLQAKQNQLTTVETMKGQIALVKQLNKMIDKDGGLDQLVDDMQDAMAENQEQQMNINRMNEMMTQMVEMTMEQTDMDGLDVNSELEKLQMECDAEKLAGLTDVAPAEQQVEATPQKQAATNNIDDLL